MNIRDQINAEYAEQIRDHYEENRAAAEEMKNDLLHSPLEFGGRLLDMPLAIQKVYTQMDEVLFKVIVQRMHGICCKAIRHYLDDPEYRRLFGFDPRLEELILADPGYDAMLPIARFDIFYNEDNGNFKFCEINTDGTSAMNEDYLLDQLNIKNPAHQAILRKYDLRSYELFDSWVNTFLDIYQTYYRAKDDPCVAIVDILDRGIVPEFYEFARRFQKAGIRVQVLDARSLRYENGKLLSPEGYEIDAVYRRAVTADLMDAYDDVQPLIRAYLDGNVFFCGSFRTQVVHTKTFFNVIHRPETQEFLTNEEQHFVKKHVPLTCDFRTPDHSDGIRLENVIADKDRFILKPNDSFGSNGVADGKGHTQEEWEKICREYYNNGYVCQEYAPQFATENVDFMFGDGKFHDYINMSGLYDYNGRFAGVYTRQSPGTIIASHVSERNVASYLVTGERQPR